MIVDEILAECLKKRREHFASREEKEPNFHIYIGHGLYREMMYEFKGPVPEYAYEVYSKGTLLGNKIFRVSDHEFWKVFKV